MKDSEYLLNAVHTHLLYEGESGHIKHICNCVDRFKGFCRQSQRICEWIQSQLGEYYSLFTPLGLGGMDQQTVQELRYMMALLWVEMLKDEEEAQPQCPEGYTVEELEKDNPYNQWMYE